MIKFVIHGHRYWDATNGNSYWLSTLTATNSGRSIHFYDECPGNVASRIRDAGYEWEHILECPFGEIKYREWQRLCAITERTHGFEVSSANIRGLVRNIRKAA